jgi:hypothetical protein
MIPHLHQPKNRMLPHLPQPKYRTLLFLVSLFLLVLCVRNVFTSTSTLLIPYASQHQVNMHQSTDDAKRRNATAKTTTCLVHSSQNISEGWKIEGGTMHQMTNQCGTLRRHWSENAPHSKHATWMLRHQSDCTKPFATHYLDNTCEFTYVVVLCHHHHHHPCISRNVSLILCMFESIHITHNTYVSFRWSGVTPDIVGAGHVQRDRTRISDALGRQTRVGITLVDMARSRIL